MVACTSPHGVEQDAQLERPALSQAEIDFYRAEGYLVVRDVLRPAELERARAIVDDFIERSR